MKMPKFVVLEIWSDGSWDLEITEGRNAEEVYEEHEHNQNSVEVFELSEFLEKLKEIDIIKYMHEEHVL
ncbi:MAG: hypothetical protein DRP16_02765 [Candidatus Aenigmatarchaeota archaeon]|nr:MAG: hypothetical protein DRP16_02765 [Candidatus Aenigmarchaeota archaeon]